MIVTSRRCCWHLRGGGCCSTSHSAQTNPITTNNYPASRVSSAEIEKPRYRVRNRRIRAISWFHIQFCLLALFLNLEGSRLRRPSGQLWFLRGPGHQSPFKHLDLRPHRKNCHALTKHSTACMPKNCNPGSLTVFKVFIDPPPSSSPFRHSILSTLVPPV